MKRAQKCDEIREEQSTNNEERSVKSEESVH
jgi:hypothetical protein